MAHVARVYDYWLGGKDNFAADRAAGDQAIAAYPVWRPDSEFTAASPAALWGGVARKR